MQRPPAKWAAALAALSMLASCAGFSIATVAIGMPKAPAMRTRGPSLRSGPSKKAGAVMALAGDSGSDTLQREKDEREVDALTEAGKKELEGLAQLNAEEQEQLRKKIEEDITLAMTGASMEMLEEYDTKTQEILDRMKKDRDIIREETANLEKLAKQMETPLWWQKGENAPKPGEKGSSNFSVPLALAWMFGFAGANELYQMYLADEGIQFIGGAKSVFDLFLAVVSGSIAFRKNK